MQGQHQLAALVNNWTILGLDSKNSISTLGRVYKGSQPFQAYCCKRKVLALRSRLCDTSLSHLMKIAIESPDKLTDSDLEDIVDVWNRKSRRIAV